MKRSDYIDFLSLESGEKIKKGWAVFLSEWRGFSLEKIFKLSEDPLTPFSTLNQYICGNVKVSRIAGWWWHTPLIPGLGRQRQVDLCEFKVSLVYRVSSRTDLVP